jgi:hypothetical protein
MDYQPRILSGMHIQVARSIIRVVQIKDAAPARK